MRPFDPDVLGFIMGIHIATVKTEQVTARRAVATAFVSIRINSWLKPKTVSARARALPRKQKRPAEAGRFELTKLNEPGSFIMNRLRELQHACAGGSRVSGSRSSNTIDSLKAD
jgi:hypothetical protein